MINRNRLTQVDALRGIAIFLVVLGHSIIVYPVNLHEIDLWRFIYNLINSVHLPLFFLISGFCFAYRGDYKTYIAKKIQRLLIPYFVFNLLNFMMKSIFSNVVNKTKGITEAIIETLLEGGEYWFLYVLFIIFFIFPMIYRLIKQKRFHYYCLMMILVLMICFVPDYTIFRFSSLIYYLFFFVLGLYIKEFHKDIVFSYSMSKISIIVSMIVLVGIWTYTSTNTNQFISIVCPLFGIGFLYLLVSFDTVVNMFKDFGKYSLQLYLLNGYFLVVSRTIIVNYLGISSPIAIVCFNMFIDFFVSYLFIKYVCSRIPFVRKMMGFVQ